MVIQSVLYFRTFQQGSADDTAANWIKFKCRDIREEDKMPVEDLVKDPGHGNWGTWSGWSQSCPEGWWPLVFQSGTLLHRQGVSKLIQVAGSSHAFAGCRKENLDDDNKKEENIDSRALGVGKKLVIIIVWSHCSVQMRNKSRKHVNYVDAWRE